MPAHPVQGTKDSKPRFKSAKEELPVLSREYLLQRNEQMRTKNLTAQMELAIRRTADQQGSGHPPSQLYNGVFTPAAPQPSITSSQTRWTGCRSNEKGFAGNRHRYAQRDQESAISGERSELARDFGEGRGEVGTPIANLRDLPKPSPFFAFPNPHELRFFTRAS